MTYKIKRTKKLPASYWEKRELENLKRKYRKRGIPPFIAIAREETRRLSGIQGIIHKKGAVVQYNEGIAKVKKVSKKGLTLEPYTNPNTNKGIASPSGKEVFVPEKKVESKVYPFYTRIPINISPPLMMEY
jgi:hypothetical protein